MMNVGIYLSVSAKNKAMNAGDAAALAAAQHQGSLLNTIGQMNIDHLKAALADDEEQCDLIMTNQLRCCFLGPIDGLAVDRGGFSYVYGCITAGNEAAKANGAVRNEGMEKVLRKLAQGIRETCVPNPEEYPEPWPGAWEEYAQRLEGAANAGIWAGPDNISIPTYSPRHILLNPSFYHAVQGVLHCWFKFNAPGLPETWNDYHDWPPLPRPNSVTARMNAANSMVYSLHLRPRIGSAVHLLGKETVCRLTGASESSVKGSRLLNDPTQQWMFYDTDVWRKWWEIDPYGEWRFPAVGPVKREYDVRGAAAACRVYCEATDLFGAEDGSSKTAFAWSAAAKPFGTAENEEGELSDVTALNAFVIPSFDATRLVPIDTISGGCGETIDGADLEWMQHILVHVPEYLQSGNFQKGELAGCWFCQQIGTWEQRAFRSMLALRIKLYGDECERPTPGPGGSSGGSAHGH